MSSRETQLPPAPPSGQHFSHIQIHISIDRGIATMVVGEGHGILTTLGETLPRDGQEVMQGEARWSRTEIVVDPSDGAGGHMVIGDVLAAGSRSLPPSEARRITERRAAAHYLVSAARSLVRP